MEEKQQVAGVKNSRGKVFLRVAIQMLEYSIGKNTRRKWIPWTQEESEACLEAHGENKERNFK